MKFKLNKRIVYGSAMGCLFAVTAIAAFFSAKDTVSNRFLTKNMSTYLSEPNWKPTEATNITPEEVVDKDPKITNDGEIDVYTYLVVTVPYYQQYVFAEDQAGQAITVSEGTANVMTSTPLPMFRFITSGMSDTDNYNSLNSDLQKLEQQVNSGWSLVKGYPKAEPWSSGANSGVITYVYAYTGTSATVLKPLPVGAETPTLFDKVKLVNIRENNVNPLENIFANTPLGVEVTSKCIQTGVGSTDKDTVWELLKDE